MGFKRGSRCDVIVVVSSGYYTRVAAIQGILRQFLAAGGPDLPKQVVCLGAGFDTTYFQKRVRCLNAFHICWLHAEASPSMISQKGFWPIT